MTLNHVQIFLEHIFDCLKLIEVDSSYFSWTYFWLFEGGKNLHYFYMCIFEGGSSHRGGDEAESGGELTSWGLFHLWMDNLNKNIFKILKTNPFLKALFKPQI